MTQRCVGSAIHTKRGVSFQPAELLNAPIRDDQLHTKADGRWGQLKRPRRGQCG